MDRAVNSVAKNRRAGDLWADRVFRGLAFGAGLTVLAVLALIAYSTTKEAWPEFREE
jgi:ABC-type phosphate transport system permease subunit